MAVNSSRTFSAVFADVSKNSSPASRAYASASAVVIARLSGCSATRSDLFPARAIMMFSFACLWSSFTHDFALSRDDYLPISRAWADFAQGIYSLCDIVNHDCTVCVPIVHRCKRLVSLLACRIPYFELDSRGVVEGDGLCEEGSSDSRFSVVIELILETNQQSFRTSISLWRQKNQLLVN